MIALLRTATVFTFTLTVLTGVVYPLMITGLAQAVFPGPANGSLIQTGDEVVGSQWIGQSFTSPGYFWGRPSATSSVPYDAASSAASNLAPSNPALAERMDQQVTYLKEQHPGAGPVPLDLITTSASGLDPHISPEAAFWQVQRVAEARHLPPGVVHDLVAGQVEGRTLGILGEPRVNILLLNLALDQTTHAGHR